MFKFLQNSSPNPKVSLHQLDHLYQHAVSKLSKSDKIAYCERLIERSRFHLEQSCPKKEAAHLKKLITAADEEIRKLRLHKQY